jgi:hypothetical protein
MILCGQAPNQILDMVNRCVVCQDAASDGTSIDGTLRDANGRRWPAGPARTLVSTDATTVAKSARADGQLGEGADPNERVRLIDGAAPESGAGGLFGSTMLTGAQRPAGRRHAPPVGWPATAPTSTIIVGRDIGEAQFGQNWRRAIQIVTPATVVRWHRRAFAACWRWNSRPRRVGRPTLAAEIRTLIRQMHHANPLWGAPRIHSELLKLGIEVAQATVAKYLARRGGPPSQS